MAQALYRKYRPKSLSELVGQAHITETLARALKTGRVSHAYLLTGPRGVGKTSIARIMAHDINGLPYSDDGHLDIIEIDAASNNGVDDVRDLRDKVRIAPVSLPKKIYIIDEVHMLSKPAFNALLKTLEEPPEHVVFILATTEVHKLPDTILSRTQRFHFRPIGADDTKKHLKSIAKKEKIAIDDDALAIIAERAGGSFRDAISLLDQLSNLSDKEVSADMVEDALGLAPTKQLRLLADAITTRQLSVAVSLLGTLESSGVSPVVLSEQLAHVLKPSIISQPRLIELLDQLIEVGRSYNPHLKLLASVALAASGGEEAAKEEPLKTAKATTAIQSIAVAPPAQKVEKTATPEAVIVKASKTKLAKSTNKADVIEWPKVIEYVRANHPPLYGVLKNANASFEGTFLNLHFNFGLHKKKLDEGKYRQLLLDSLDALYKNIPDIRLTHGKLPPKNQQARAVADIMGGGEEVALA
jgi:DNA polymerase-3 subunit gamma/tau